MKCETGTNDGIGVAVESWLYIHIYIYIYQENTPISLLSLKVNKSINKRKKRNN